ncbi:hypothetical protein AgCh_033315 [Apium graveolens]
MKRSTTIADLHEKFLDILRFLPPKSIIRCSCVCKDWANLIYQPYFPHEYFLKRKPPLQVMLKRNNGVEVAQHDADRVSNPSEVSVPKKVIYDIDLRQVFGISSIVFLDMFQCQDTGWILAFSRRWSSSDPEIYKLFESWYHMYNPITGQHIAVQKAMMNDDGNVASETGALIWAQKTNQLKLLVFHPKHITGPVEAYVQTIGTSTWKSIGELPQYSGQDQPVLVNGMCHWLNSCNAVIHAFDAEEEKFQVIETPSCFKNCCWSYFKSLDGCLCLELTIRDDVREIWVMKKYGIQDSWSKI